MIISLIGYMGSGKSHISKLLSEKINFQLFDLDKVISTKYQQTIPEIFQNKGEISFRKLEKETLEEILEKEKQCILSVGGGTPVYYNNMDVLNEKTITIYLRANISTLTERLVKQKEKRPIIARISDEDLPEFIAKHLFERNVFYNKSQFIIDTDNKSPEVIVEEILAILPQHQ